MGERGGVQKESARDELMERAGNWNLHAEERGELDEIWMMRMDVCHTERHRERGAARVRMPRVQQFH